MDAPKCKTCGERHYGLCLGKVLSKVRESVTKKARSSTAERPPLTPQVAGSSPAAPTKPKVGRPRIEDRDKTLAATKPWAVLGMSESTWRRRQAEQRAK